MDISYFNLEIFSPESHFGKLQEALRDADAGHIANYDSCLSYSRVMSTWRPLAGTNPYSGEIGTVSEEPEYKVEVTVKAEKLKQTIAAVRAVHPYEEPVINALPLYAVGISEE